MAKLLKKIRKLFNNVEVLDATQYLQDREQELF